ncbi:hypothetical protein Hanom_Chr01g00057801 [Helianthus anomalus]
MTNALFIEVLITLTPLHNYNILISMQFLSSSYHHLTLVFKGNLVKHDSATFQVIVVNS